LGGPRVTLAFLPLSALFGVLCVLAGQWVTAAALLALWAVAYSLVVLNSITLRQRVTPDRLQSRVNTAGRMLSFGVGWPIGALLGGVISEAAGPRAAMVWTSTLVVLAAVVAWLSPLRGMREVPDVPSEADPGQPRTRALEGS
jgi:predicted MFS family arabinose efflux permease